MRVIFLEIQMWMFTGLCLWEVNPTMGVLYCEHRGRQFFFIIGPLVFYKFGVLTLRIINLRFNKNNDGEDKQHKC